MSHHCPTSWTEVIDLVDRRKRRRLDDFGAGETPRDADAEKRRIEELEKQVEDLRHQLSASECHIPLFAARISDEHIARECSD